MKKYLDPEMEITEFETQDVITTSGVEITPGIIDGEEIGLPF